MSEPDLFRGAFIVDAKKEDETLQKYLERVFFAFEQHMTIRVPVMSQGHYQEIEVSAVGTTDVKIKPEHRITNVVIRPLDGAGAYIHTFKLTENRVEDSKSGDKVTLYYDAPAGTNPTMKILDQDGVTIHNRTFDGSGNDSGYITVIKIDDLWQI